MDRDVYTKVVEKLRQAEDLFGDITGKLTALETSIGDLTTLETTVKTDLVSSINEVLGDVGNVETDINGLEDDIGTLASLETTVKTDLVSAINEVFGSLPVVTSVTLTYDSTDSLRNSAVDIPTGKLLANAVVGLTSYNTTSAKIQEFLKISTTGLMAYGSGFTSEESVTVSVIWF